MSDDEDESSGRASLGTTQENVAKVREFNHEDRRQTMGDV
jgi:hypothetical protein